MGELGNAKILGGVGALLGLVGLGFIGFILKLLAVKKISEATGNDEIFQKYLYAAILGIVSSLILFVAVMLPAMRGRAMDVVGMGVVGVVGIVLLIAAVLFMKISYDLIAKETGVGMFHTVALLYIIGAVLMVVMIGALVLFIAIILEVVAFFSLPDEVPGRGEASPAI
ncbi:DUF996 domain-containing protein [Thermococcus sp. CX2]|uniref:DUF996 domain-containing protein n=1 Tax=Thermococcus sp. CX2 TaxID=163006 RepID=UPI00143C7DE8|nr:DUF996 domain-containing protein [Thermococcus sp. CX2]NJE84635.1 DUF996 domain-containing protein [Thermococcus sp. CX2]